jgi:hypothetical protein
MQNPEWLVADALAGSGGVPHWQWYVRWQYRRWLDGKRDSKPSFMTVSLANERDLLAELFRKTLSINLTPEVG